MSITHLLAFIELLCVIYSAKLFRYISLFIYLLIYFAVLGIKTSACSMLDKHSTTKLQP
jgi:hypothetical protein